MVELRIMQEPKETQGNPRRPLSHISQKSVEKPDSGDGDREACKKQEPKGGGTETAIKVPGHLDSVK